jgi:threonine dehydrogenase-like Zn-dependent dehydrogenase
MKTHRVYIPEAGKAFLAEQELDETLKPSEVLIKSHYSAISAGTETARYLGLDGDIFPTTSGGANVGEIIAVGSDVAHFAVGDRVTSFTNHDSYLKCDTVPRDFGYNGHRIGVNVPASLGGANAALVYHFNVGLAGVRESGVTLGDDALVIGGGLIGNTAAQLFRCAGAFVMLADLSEKRLAIARECGIARTVNPSKAKLADVVKEWTQGRMLHHVVQAIEGADVVEESIPLLRPHGQVVLLGGYRRSQSIDARVFGALQGGSRRMVAPSAWGYPIPEMPHYHFSIFAHFRQILTLMEERRLRTDPLITRVRPQDCQEIFQDLIHNKDKYLGAVFDWTQS